MNKRTLLERFEDSYSAEPMSGCWIWIKAINNANGYGKLSVGSKTDKSRKKKWAHRVSYELFKGDIPAGFHIDHLCRTRCCVNPHHLEAVTPKENFTRARKSHKSLPFQLKKYAHCQRGHELNTENRFIQRNGKKTGCRICRNNTRRAKRKIIKLSKIEAEI